MKTFSVLAAIAAYFLIAAPAAAQTTPGPSPQLHAWFEYEYAREATYQSLTQTHRQLVLRLAHALDNRQLSLQDAQSRINAMLTTQETDSVLQIEHSFWTAWDGIFPNAAVRPSRVLSTADQAPLGAAQFLLLLFSGMR
jgi:hypothetical protein